MSAEDDAGTTLRALGWHQGAIVAVPQKNTLRLNDANADHILVVSQDCDVVASTAIEPNVDVLPLVSSPDAARDLQHGKHPRQLCVPLPDGRFATVDIRNRQTLAKEAVAHLQPLPVTLASRERRLLAKWLGKRYARPAFPDAFNQRLRDQKSKLDKLSKKDESQLITAVLVSLNTDDELEGDQTYEVIVWLACRTDVFNNAEQRPLLETYATSFANALDACHGVKVAEYELKGHFDITFEDLEVMRRFDYDFRSEAPKPGGETAPTE